MFQRAGIKLYGVRVAEPQHDGTSHWHFLLFTPANQTSEVTAIMQHYALEEDGQEVGAEKHRFQSVPIDREKGTATGYIAKYISKNIDGYGLSSSDENVSPDKAAERVNAWAATWGIRQFQFFGGPPITLWRELRRLEPSVFDGVLRKIIEAADSGDWAEFVRLSDRMEKKLAFWKCYSDLPNRYGEERAEEIVGIEFNGRVIATHHHEWTIGKKKIEPPLIGEGQAIN